MPDTVQNRVIRSFRSSNETSPFSRLQWEAIRIGIKEGEVTLARSKAFGVFWLFLGSKTHPLADKCLEALRAYAELARIVAPREKAVPTTMLEKAGFSSRQIVALRRAVTAPVGAL